jgi:hypothetical protein
MKHHAPPQQFLPYSLRPYSRTPLLRLRASPTMPPASVDLENLRSVQGPTSPVQGSSPPVPPVSASSPSRAVAASVLLPLCLAPGWTEVLGRTGRWRGFLLGVRHRVLRCRRGSSTLMPSHSQRRGHMYPWAGTDIFQWEFKLRKKILMQDLKEKKLLILRSRFNSRSLLFWC